MDIAQRLGLSPLDLGPAGSITREIVLARLRTLGLSSEKPEIVAAAQACINEDGTLNEALRRELAECVEVGPDDLAPFEAGLRAGATQTAIA